MGKRLTCGALAVCLMLSLVLPSAAQAAQLPPETADGTENQESFLLTFAGDCTLGSTPSTENAQLGFVKTVGEDYGYPFRNVLEYVTQDDFTFINLEGPLCDGGYPAEKRFVFRGPTVFTRILTQNSIEAVSLANNHTMDYGQTGYDSTREALDAAGVPYVERDSSLLITLDEGLTIGIYGAVYYSLDKARICAGIAELREQGADLVIFAPHWGSEGGYRPTPEQQEVGRAAIDAGADLVVGSHPHVLQPIEAYGEGMIFYSLGNFAFGGNGAPKDMDTALIQQEVLRDADGSISLGQTRIIPASVSSVPFYNNFQPTPYEPESVEYERVLSKLDGTYTGPNLRISGS